MFSLHDFLMMGIKDSIGKLPDYKVIANAVGWYEKGVLITEDLSVINALLAKKNTVSEEKIEVYDEPEFTSEEENPSNG